MSFFIEPGEKAVDLVTERMRQDPVFSDRYDAIKEIRDQSRLVAPTVSEVAKANGFFRVASLQGSLADLAQVLNPDWLQNKKRFYKWLDANPQHCTYDRRSNSFSNEWADSSTFVDGKAI